jgi:predicted dehydrogenase
MLAGTGTGRKRILPGLRASELCRVTVLHGRDRGRLEEVRRTDRGVRLTTDRAEFAQLADLYDLVYIGSPPFLHLADITLAAGLGKPILCEKPLVTSTEQLAAVVDVVQASAVPFMLAHQVRHQPAVAQIKRLISSNALGSVCAAHLQWMFIMSLTAPNAVWKRDPSLAGTSAVFDSGVHAVDLAVHLFGTPRRVCATGHRRLAGEVIDSVTTILDYEAFAATITTSQAGSPDANGLTITCADGVIAAPALLGERSTQTLHMTYQGDTRQHQYPPVNLYRAEVENFCRQLTDGPIVGTTLADAVAASRIMFAIEESMASGQTALVE